MLLCLFQSDFQRKKKLADSYAKLYAISVGEAFKKTLFEKIEDKYDIAVADASHKEYLKDKETLTHEEFMKELGL